MFKKLFIVFFILSGILLAQNFNSDANKDFEKALSLFKAKNYQTALTIFQRVTDYQQTNSKLTAAEFFICKIYLIQKKYNELEKSVNNFLQQFPFSKYSDEVKNILLQSYIERKDYNDAFKSAINFLDNSTSIVFWNETKTLAEKIALNYLSSSDINEISDEVKSQSLKPFLLLLSGKLLRKEGDEKSAVARFEEITSVYRDSDEYIQALNLKKSENNLNIDTKTPVVGVMLSLTDQNGLAIASANEILSGIKFAFHEYNSAHDDKFGLNISDIKKDKNLAIEQADNFISNQNVRCILGPVFSDDVRNVLSEVNHSDLCVISPTATDDDLINLSDNFYQANPSFATRGKIFAQYLYYVENARQVGVLNSIDNYSPLLAASFSKEFEKLGGNIAVKETFKSNSYSLAEQLNKIASVTKSLDGLYIPLSDKNDATIILSSLVQSGMNIRVFGNQDWFIAKGFETSPEISNKLVFESDYFIDYNDPDFKEFNSAFKQQTGVDANRTILYGYDIAKYLITVMRNIDPTRKNIKYKMESGLNVSGFHNNISFDSERINKFINIVRYKDGIFELVDKFRSGK